MAIKKTGGSSESGHLTEASQRQAWPLSDVLPRLFVFLFNFGITGTNGQIPF
jgi:hypothetical protein